MRNRGSDDDFSVIGWWKVDGRSANGDVVGVGIRRRCRERGGSASVDAGSCAVVVVVKGGGGVGRRVVVWFHFEKWKGRGNNGVV